MSEIKKIIAERKVRRYIRKKLIEHYATNGYKNLTPEQVQEKFLQLEAKSVAAQKPKQDNKMLGSKKAIGNSAPNGDAFLGKRNKGKDVSITAPSDPVAKKHKKDAKFFVVKAGIKKPTDTKGGSKTFK